MKKKNKILTFSLVLLIIFSLSILNTRIYNTQERENEEQGTKVEESTKLNLPKSSDFWPNCPRIHIYNDNWSATDLDWIQNRTGTYDDPHIIENMTITGDGTGKGIFIDNSSDYFIVRNCSIHNFKYGIMLQDTANGTIIQNNCSNNADRGIRLINFCRNNTIVNNTATDNLIGIELYSNCDNNTILGNIACGPSQGYEIYLQNGCDNNTIIGNTINEGTYGLVLITNCNDNRIIGNIIRENSYIGIGVEDCQNNKIKGNTINEGGYGIYFVVSCYNHIISGNTINDNSYYGIFFDGGSNNNITGNTINDNGIKGIRLNSDNDDDTISENFLYFNTDGGIIIDGSDCDRTEIERNVIASKNKDYILDFGKNTFIGDNLYLTEHSLSVEIVNQSFSTDEFNIIIRLFDDFNLSTILFYDLEIPNFDVDIESIEIWWNGTVLASNNITNLGNGLYNISLIPIFVEPGDDPILLNMTILAKHHQDKYLELNLAVDPKAVEKGTKPKELLSTGNNGGNEDDEGDAELNILIITILLVGISSGIGVAFVAIILIRKRMGIKNR